MNLFRKKTYVPINVKHQQETGTTPVIPDGLWVKCLSCGKTIYSKSLGLYKTCPTCGGCFRLSARERIALIADEGSFVETDAGMRSKNPIDYPDYENKVRGLQEKTGLNDAVVTGECLINGIKTAICVMDSNFAMGSMGSVVGEKVTKTFERATENNLPIVIFTVSGGARMQEGIISLMQMAKVSAAAARHHERGLLYITVLTDPTTGGVTASFAMLGDITLSEPGAVIGFAGRRVIEQTIKQKLPVDFQTAEFVLEHGFVDKIVERPKLKDTIAKILDIHRRETTAEEVPEEPCKEAWLNNPELEHNTKSSMTAAAHKKQPSEMEAYDRVKIARRVARPTSFEYINYIFEDFLEFHGDRNFKDDKAVVGGIARLDGRPVTVIGIQRGRTTEENIERNFGSPHPEGYRKALRLMKQAEKFGRPLVIFISTSGAFCGVGAEERGQGEAIARNLFEMSKLRVPIISIVIGEGGSGGALALAVADRVWMLGNSVYSILSPEGFASILWKDAGRASEAAGIMKITADDLLGLGVIDKIIDEPPEGAERDFENIAGEIKACLLDELTMLGGLDTGDLIEKRYCRFRSFGEFEE